MAVIEANTVVGGRYRVFKPLGGGGMKMVYLAEDLRLASRPCALAEMVDSFTSPNLQQQAVASFQREADMLATLSNEHIPRVFDRFSDQNRHYLVMEYIEGVTLEQRMRDAGGRLAESEVIDLAIQVCQTLEYLHGLTPPVVYRDLKPSNVMLTKGGQAKLIDFGIARHFRPLSNATMIGTQGYAPPEQYRGKVEFRSDIYALGATMHHALSGRDPALEPPFSFPPLRQAAPGITPALADLVDQALKYDVALRVSDATEFRERLLAIKSGNPAPASAPQSAAAADAHGAPSRSQLRLPLQTPVAGASTPSAPTRLTNPDEMGCPQCGRTIPVDSRFCSFCAADLRNLAAPNGQASAQSQTIVLAEPVNPSAEPREPEWARTGSEPQRRNLPYLLIAALFAGAFILTSIVAYVITRPSNAPPDTPYPSAPSIPAPSYGPGVKEPPHTNPRLMALRQMLDTSGYRNVHFRMEGDTIILWGTVPTEADRMMVQTMVFTVAGIYSIVDHLQVTGGFAGP
jgi:serine/threonine protein kinase